MPNWSTNTIIIQGHRSDMQNFIGLGLRNSKLEPTGDIDADFLTLVDKGTTRVQDEIPASPREREAGHVAEVADRVWLSARTFFPMPDTYLKHDTTNYAGEYPAEVIAEQSEMGAVGWYEYNLITLGVKWNFSLNEGDDIEFHRIGDTDLYRMTIQCETAWSTPDGWLARIKREFPGLDVLIFAREESLLFYFYGFATENGVETVEDAAEEMAEIESRMYSEDGDDKSDSTCETDEGETETAIDGDAVADQERLCSRMWDGFMGFADEFAGGESGDGGEG